MANITTFNIDGVEYDISTPRTYKYASRVTLNSYTESDPYTCPTDGIMILNPSTGSCCFTVKDILGGSFNFRSSFGTEDQLCKSFKIFKLSCSGGVFYSIHIKIIIYDMLV